MTSNCKYLFPFIAPPNGGKGTQTRLLNEKYQLPTFDMGATFRAIVKENTDPELKAEICSFIDNGRLVPVETVAKVFTVHFKRLMKACPDLPAFILDGFPRSKEQAEILDDFCKAEQGALVFGKAIYLNIGMDTVKKRATGRRFCTQENAHVYNINIDGFKPIESTTDGHTEWLCPIDNGVLFQRKDDAEETVVKRLREYALETDPLIEYFKNKNLLCEINGEQSPDQIASEIDQIILPFLAAS
ncbi:MAG: nucleoside monophosphate kinase [Cyanobacteria bacterium P01_H01_bin.74]